MSFDYDELKNKEDGGTHWATYSDLFMVLSLVFLLLYVVASVRTGTSNIKSNADYMAVVREKEDLKTQLAIYETQKKEYLEQKASADQFKQYDELMDNLSLLQREAKEEKDELRKAARENEKKENALNKYQKMVRNIINSNLVASSNLQKRQNTIERRNDTIDEQVDEIKELETTVEEKKKQIKRDSSKIKNLNASLSKKIRDIKKANQQKKISKKNMQKKIQALKMQNQKKVKQLQQANQQASQLISQNQQKIQEVTQQLDQAEQTIASQQSSIEQLYEDQEKTFEKMVDMQAQFKDQMAKEKAQFNAQLNQEKLSAAQKAQKLKEFQKQAQAKEGQMAQKISKMESQVQGIQGALDQTRQAQANAEAQSKALAAKNQSLQGQKAQLSGDLKRMKDIANAKNKLISDMKANLAKVGLKAEVGAGGDVIIEFGEEYFDTGKSSMKPGMEKVLKKFMPAYSKSLFSNEKTAEKIESIEIVGYASPTYQGRYVDPKSLDAKDKEAVNYNLSLSFNRAKSIFNYIYDQDKMTYGQQKRIRSMTKVTGRSFLAEGAEQRVPANMSQKEYCKKFDCKKSQRVVIKFNMKN